MRKLHLKFAASFAASAAVCVVALAQNAPTESEALHRFVKHPTHCLQLFAGDGYGDTVTDEWSRDLAAAMPGGLKDAPRDLERVKAACEAELQSRAALGEPTVAKTK